MWNVWVLMHFLKQIVCDEYRFCEEKQAYHKR